MSFAEQIIISILTGGGVIFGVLISSILNILKSKLDNRRIDIKEYISDQNTRLENLYRKKHKYRNEVSGFFSSFMEYVNGEILGDVIHEKLLQYIDRQRDIVEEIELNIDFYYPELRESWDSAYRMSFRVQLEVMKLVDKNEYQSQKNVADIIMKMKKIQDLMAICKEKIIEIREKIKHKRVLGLFYKRRV